MKRISDIYNVILGMFWESVYVFVIIGVGLSLAVVIQYIR